MATCFTIVLLVVDIVGPVFNTWDYMNCQSIVKDCGPRLQTKQLTLSFLLLMLHRHYQMALSLQQFLKF